MLPNYLARGYQGLHVKQANKTNKQKPINYYLLSTTYRSFTITYDL